MQRGHRGFVGSACVWMALVTALGAPIEVEASPSGGALPPPLIEVIEVAGTHGVPADASMAAFNITAVSPAADGFLTVYPCDQPVPSTSNVNYLAGDVAPSLVLSRIAADGTVCIATYAVTDVLADLIGYVPVGSAVTPLPQPQRALDTRTTQQTPVPAGSGFGFQLGGKFGVPADADTVLFNVTAIGRDQAGFVTVWPCDTEQPGTSSVNYLPFEVSPNFVVSGVAADGTACFFTSAAADIVVDVAAYSRGGIETLSRPERILDTRLSGGPLAPGRTEALDVTARADVPDDATAALYNLTAIDATAPGFVTSHACDVDLPQASNLNYAPGGVAANTSITQLSADGRLCVYSLASANLVVDLIGYVRGSADYVPLAPVRLLDTRVGWQPSCQWVIALTWVSLSTSEVRVTNVVTGVSFVGPQVPVDLQRANEPFVDRDCTGYWYGTGTFPTQLVFVPFPGSAAKAPLPANANLAIGGLRGYGQFPDGTTVGVTQFGDVYRLADGTLLAELPVRGFVMQADVSRSGLVALRLGAIATSTSTDPGHIQVWDMSTATLISDIAVDRLTDSMDLSPDGTYLALDTNTFATNVTAVITLDGTVVDTVTRSGNTILRSFFWGDGSLFLCADREGIFTWNLFSTPSPIASASDARFFGTLRSSDPFVAKPCNLMWT